MPERRRPRERSAETERYREAAAEALNQLDWVIDYLYRIHKPRIAEALQRNRTEIAKRLR